MASEEKSCENVDDDDRRTTGAWLYYKLTYGPSAQVSLNARVSVQYVIIAINIYLFIYIFIYTYLLFSQVKIFRNFHPDYVIL